MRKEYSAPFLHRDGASFNRSNVKSFKDTEGREWLIAVNVDSIKRVRALCGGLDFLSAVEGDLFARLGSDPVLLVDAVYAVCKPQADERGITDEQFGKAMAGDAIDAATEALLDEICDFFPSGRRTILQKALKKFRAAETEAVKIATEKVDAINVSDLMHAVSGDSSTSSPAE